ncbi:3-hydroxyacyl-CoA dehydrogenase family protein [Blastopirellula sp. JC732]|uniref:3-hydroxyacyl-CoA dehydrogenase family protein n=1 Tax=Blastopirellula sediminis TaxID=2894196 RepID=A0A9X1MRJ4_9BACT|nr:3-hydroxyacyl-CoA dehydrogenase family protein [Blastopirellula sediminis]MCC9605543.1 3-hydroxyacyl-CoA dehydrogenase family protein [Blastopirellula sediminis]MCC9631157.1 3-hydroxyacyl-CoA dehydrogenase family protein [Blastopirellula sediminis]
MNIRKVGVVGLGLMGRGICTSLLANNMQVVAFDIDPVSFDAAQSHIAHSLAELAQHPVDSEVIPTDWQSNLQLTDDLSAMSNCDFVIESIPEDPVVKRQAITQLEQLLPQDVPIASNTSALPISLLQQQCQYPQRIVGMHWAEPCHLTRFLEIIRGEKTNDATAEAAADLGRLLGKDPTIVLRDVPGFIVNRLAYAMYREAFWLLENNVADVDTIDRAFVNAISVWANVAGPFRWMDLSGLPAYAQAMGRLFPELSQATETPASFQRMIDEGARGIANGRGFYSYTAEEADAWRDKLVANVHAVRQLSSQSHHPAKDLA